MGSLKIGMALSAIPVALKQPINRTIYRPDGGCFYVFPEGGPRYNMMIEHGRLTRIDLIEPGITTAAGVSVGDPIASVKKAYGAKAHAEPNSYNADFLDFTVKSADGTHAIVIGTDGVQVTSIVAGLATSVAYVEGCS